MKLLEISKSDFFSKEEKEAAQRWFDFPTNSGKEIEGTKDEVKQKLQTLQKNYLKRKEREAKKGTFNEVMFLVRSLTKGTRSERAPYTYKDIVNIINEATEKRRAQIEMYYEKKAELEKLRADLNL